HPALAQHAKQLVLAEDKAPVLSREQLLGLPLGQQTGLDELLGERFLLLGQHSVVFFTNLGQESLQLIFFDQLTASHKIHKALSHCFCHELNSGVGGRVPREHKGVRNSFSAPV